MRTSRVTTTALFLSILFAGAGVAVGAERFNVIEMGDGHQISFPMTPDEIAAADAAHLRWTEQEAGKRAEPAPRVLSFEMGESGQTISFAMTAEEIAADDAVRARRASLEAETVREPEPLVVRYELPESGNYIVFPVAGSESPAGRTMDVATTNGG